LTVSVFCSSAGFWCFFDFASGVGQKKTADGHTEFVIQGDVRYDLATFLHAKWNTPTKLIFYKTLHHQTHGLEPAFASDGVALPPP